MRRFLTCSVLAILPGFIATRPASAQQSLNLQIGGFVPTGSQTADGTVINDRSTGDVLAGNISSLDFNLTDFDGLTFNGEWLVGVGDKVEAGLGIGFYSKTVPSVDAAFTNANGSEIQLDLKLRVVPFSATVRFLPMGRRSGIVPYIGAGVGVFSWRYQESGQYIDPPDRSLSKPPIYTGTFTGSGSTTGPVVLGGIRVPVGDWGVGGEIRYQHAKGNLPGDQGFAGSTIDLGGFNYLFTINVRF